MNIEECKLYMMVHVTGADDSIGELGGGDIMRSMIRDECEIIQLNSNGKSVQIQSEDHGSWWFLPSDIRPLDMEIEPNIFHFDEANL